MTDVHDSYNLIDRPCLPVQLTDGGFDELSIRDTFHRARMIRTIEGEQPIMRFPLTRLLIAVLYGAFPDPTPDEWRELYDAGPDDPDVIGALDDYLDEYHDRFDLFDPVAPFYQTAGLTNGKDDGMFGLDVLMIQSDDFHVREHQPPMNPGEAFRRLVVKQAYDWSGNKTGAVGDPFVKGGKGYPLGVAWCGNYLGVLLEGADLWSTLMLNMVGPQVLTHGDPGVTWVDDRPIWEREPSTPARRNGFSQNEDADTGRTTFMHGPATLLTWQSRRIRLIHSDNMVTGAIVCNGDRLKSDNAYAYEPMASWHKVRDAKTLRRLGLTSDMRADMAEADSVAWRGLPALAADTTDADGVTRLRPYTLRWLAADVHAADRPVTLGVYGVVYGNQSAVVERMIADRIDLRLTDADGRDPERVAMLRDAVAKAVDGAKTIGVLGANIRRASRGPAKLNKACESPEYAHARREATIALEHAFRGWVRHPDDDTTKAIDDWTRLCARTLERVADRIEAGAPARAVIGRDLGEDDGGWMTSARAGAICRAKLRRLYPAAYKHDHENTLKTPRTRG